MSVSILCRFIVHLTKSAQHTVNVSFFLNVECYAIYIQ